MANVSPGLAQNVSIADIARQERARRKALDQPWAVLADDVVLDKEKLVAEALEISGAKKQLRNMTDASRPFAERDRRNDPAKVEKVRRAFSEAFAPETTEEAMKKLFAEAIDETTLAQCVAWYRTPLGVKIVELEILSSDKSVAEEKLKFVRALEADPPAQARIRLIDIMDEQTQSTERTIEFLSAFMKAMYQGLDPNGPTANFRAVDRAIRGSRDQMRESTIIGHLFTYRSLTEAEIREYLGFLGSEPGQLFVDAIWKGMHGALVAGAEDLGRRLSADVKTANR